MAIARLLLDHGADPNDFYMAGDAKYSVLTGFAGEGEQDAPRQPYAKELFDLLLERGAEPFDIQVLYDTHFRSIFLLQRGLEKEPRARPVRADVEHAPFGIAPCQSLSW